MQQFGIPIYNNIGDMLRAQFGQTDERNYVRKKERTDGRFDFIMPTKQKLWGCKKVYNIDKIVSYSHAHY